MKSLTLYFIGVTILCTGVFLINNDPALALCLFGFQTILAAIALD